MLYFELETVLKFYSLRAWNAQALDVLLFKHYKWIHLSNIRYIVTWEIVYLINQYHFCIISLKRDQWIRCCVKNSIFSSCDIMFSRADQVGLF